MKYDFSHFSPEQFERFCAALVAAEGFQLDTISWNSEADRGIDFTFQSADGVRWIGQSKLFRRNMPAPSRLRSALIDLQNGLAQVGAQKAVLMVSVPVSTASRGQLPPALCAALVFRAPVSLG
jgi:hypothetical protein